MLGTIFQQIFPPSHPALALAPRAPAAAAPAEVDVEKILNDREYHSGQPLSWRTSIVDLLQLLELDSSLQSRQGLARELYYAGDTDSPASMNVWLHRQVMNKLAQNGGTVPADLKD